jgi:hypothetical protein
MRRFVFSLAVLAMLGGVSGIPAALACPSGNGLYCSDTMGEPYPDNLFYCRDMGGWDQITLVAFCGFGCHHNRAGLDDQCNPCQYGNGYYCSSSLTAENFPVDDNNLWLCQNGRMPALPTQVCGGQCVQAPPHQNDHC